MFILLKGVAVGRTGLGVMVWYGVSTPVGLIVGVAWGVGWRQPLNKNPRVVIRKAILRTIDPDYTQ
jgi:hypothetical protein